VVAVSSLPPATGVEDLVAALDEHRAGLDIDATRARMRRLTALAAFAAEHGDGGIRALGGRREAERKLAALDRDRSVPEIVAFLEAEARPEG
jgi:LAO/AO transport system kinase